MAARIEARVGVVALALLSGCPQTKAPPEAARARPPDPPAAPAPDPPRPERVLGAHPLIHLEVPGHLSAVVSVPLGADSPRPVAVVTHGNYSSPIWDCPLWRGILGGDVFILCPRGVEREDQPPPATPEETIYTYGSAEELAREIDAGLAALGARFPGFVAEGPVLYAGCSRGAFLGASLGPREPGRFTRLALVEGGHDPWTPANVKRFAEGGGERVLFTCGQYACYEAAQGKARMLRAAGVAAEVAYAPLMGHACHDRVATKTKEAIPWLLSGDRRWRVSG